MYRKRNKPFQHFRVFRGPVYVLILSLFAFASQAGAQQPVWTDILNQQGFTNMASGTYYDVGPLGRAPAVNTDLAGIQPVANTLSLPANSLPSTGGAANCGNSVNYPLAFIESNPGTGIKGVGFLGSFNSPYPLSYLGGNIFSAVFFHDNPCYNGGREYGFFLATYDNSIWVYWGTNENLPSVVQAQIQLPNISVNTQYYFEIYPTPVAGSCGFQVIVLTPGFQTVYSSWFGVNSNNYPAGSAITTTDPGFCSSVASSSGDTGYVSANIEPSSTALSGTLPPASSLNVNMQRVFVGK